MPKCTILIGIPTSGKSTWCRNNTWSEDILSCDHIRLLWFGKHYKYNQSCENDVWKHFYESIEKLVIQKEDFVIDNTNCRKKYINEITKRLTEDYKIEYIWFDIPLWKAYCRNIKRWIFEDKWIPTKVLKSMNFNYNKLKKEWKE